MKTYKISCFLKKLKRGIAGVIDQKVDDGMQRALDKMDAIADRLESKIGTTNSIVVGLGVTIIGGIIAGVVINFLSKK